MDDRVARRRKMWRREIDEKTGDVIWIRGKQKQKSDKEKIEEGETENDKKKKKKKKKRNKWIKWMGN